MNDIKFDFDDILIRPSDVTNISTRKDIDPYDKMGFLPIFTAPMDTVVDDTNEHIFLENKINVCLPRHISGGSSETFLSYSLKDFQYLITSNTLSNKSGNYLIDIANGHMNELILVTMMAKKTYPEITLMVGNVATPQAYVNLSNAGADYIRVGIGNGGGCLTTQQLGVGYPMASLIKECYEASCTIDNPAKIVADGGMKKYADIIKALALGADYVMLGSILNKTLESCSDKYVKLDNHAPMKIDDYRKYASQQLIAGNEHATLKELMYEGKLYNKFRGMSTKEVQLKWGNNELKTSEGVVKWQQVEYTVAGWVENFEHYLRSAMSYTNALTLSEFIGNVKTIKITQKSFERYNK